MNSITKLCRLTSRRSSGIFRRKFVLNRISSFNYFSAKQIQIDTKRNKKDNIDMFGECECGRHLFQQWRSCFPVYVSGNKQCEDCGVGCIEYINKQYGDKPLGPCCNLNCSSNKVARKSFFNQNSIQQKAHNGCNGHSHYTQQNGQDTH